MKVRCWNCRREFEQSEDGWSLECSGSWVDGDHDPDFFCSDRCLYVHAVQNWTESVERRLRALSESAVVPDLGLGGGNLGGSSLTAPQEPPTTLRNVCFQCANGQHSKCCGDFNPKDWCACEPCKASPFAPPPDEPALSPSDEQEGSARG